MFSPFDFFRVQCKFFAHGACLKGEHCEFSHDWNAPPNNVTFCQPARLKSNCLWYNVIHFLCYSRYVPSTRKDSVLMAVDVDMNMPNLQGYILQFHLLQQSFPSPWCSLPELPDMTLIVPQL